MSKLVLLSLLLTGCFFDHPQYCHTHGDCLDGQYCPAIRSPEQLPLICKGKAIVTPMKLGD